MLVSHLAGSKFIENVTVAFKMAIDHQKATRLPEAEQICRQILQQQPNHAESWNLLGAPAYQLGKHETAIECISKAVEISPLYRFFLEHHAYSATLRRLTASGIPIRNGTANLTPQPPFPTREGGSQTPLSL